MALFPSRLQKIKISSEAMGEKIPCQHMSNFDPFFIWLKGRCVRQLHASFKAWISRKALSVVLAPQYPEPALGSNDLNTKLLLMPVGIDSVHAKHGLLQAMVWPEGFLHNEYSYHSSFTKQRSPGAWTCAGGHIAARERI